MELSDLIRLAAHADKGNLGRLALGFPAIATAVDNYKNTHGGIDLLRRLASRATSVRPDAGSPKEEGNENG